MKNDKLDILFREIGEIDDSFLNEALTYKRQEKKSLGYLKIAACIALVFALCTLFPSILRRVGNMSSGEAEKPGASYASLDHLMMSVERDDYSPVVSIDDYSYFSGEASIIWQYGDGETYSSAITGKQFAELSKDLGKGENVGEESSTLSCMIWVSDGEGNVYSPYLKAGAGNSSHSIFSYEAEIVPSEGVVDLITEFLNRDK